MTPRRAVLIAAAYALLVFCETGFFASLPEPLRFLPLTFAVGVYLVQSRDWWPAAWFVAGFGLFLDVSGIAPVPVQTAAYAAAGAAAFVSARSLFSNRSLYGILGCGAVAWAAHAAVQTAVWLLRGLLDDTFAPVGPYAVWMGWRLLLLLAALIVLFYAAARRTRIALDRRR